MKSRFSHEHDRVSGCTAELVRFFEKHATVRLYNKGKKLDLLYAGENVCYLILDGVTVFYRDYDNIALQTVTAPGILGLGNSSKLLISGYIKTITPCKIGIISTDKVYEIIKENQLWELLALHMIKVANRLFKINMVNSQPTTYPIIREQLKELMAENVEIISNVTAANYILNKTNISRSQIMAVISSLKKGGFIELEGGKLIKIYHLPDSY